MTKRPGDFPSDDSSKKVEKRTSRSLDDNRNTLYCNFCGKSQHEVVKLIAGPKVFICDECTTLCINIVNEDDWAGGNKAPNGLLRYVLGIDFDRNFEPLESELLPAIIRNLQNTYQDCKISIKRFEVNKKGGHLFINFDSPVKIPRSDIASLQAEIQHLSRMLKIEQEKFLAERGQRLRFEEAYRELTDSVMPLMIENLKRQGRIASRDIKTLLIMFADIVGFSRLENDERQQKLDLMRVIARPIIKSDGGLYLNSWGDGLIAAFDDPNQGLRCACKFVQHLNVDGVDVRVGVGWGAARIVFNEITRRLDVDGNSVNVSARIEPLASSGEVLASDLVYALPEIDRESFSFTERDVKLEKAVGGSEKGDTIKVFRVSYLPNK